MRPIRLRLRHGVDALGNAIGDSIADSSQRAAALEADQKRSGAEDAAAQVWAFDQQERSSRLYGLGGTGARFSSVNDEPQQRTEHDGNGSDRRLGVGTDLSALPASWRGEPWVRSDFSRRLEMNWNDSASGARLPTAAFVDEMGQPLFGRSNYNSFSKLGEILGGARFNSLSAVGDTLSKLGSWLTYEVPDAAQRRAEVRAQLEGFGNADTVRLDKMRESVLGSVLWSGLQTLGTSVDTSDRLLDIGTALSGLSLAGSALTGRVADIFGAQRPSTFPTESPYALTSRDYVSSFSRGDKMRLGLQLEANQSLLFNETLYNGQTATQLYVRAFDGKGGLAPGSVRLDQVGLRADGGYDLNDMKLSPRSPLTVRQAEHYSLLAQYGGIVTGLRGDGIGLPRLSILPPTPVSIYRGPFLRLGGQ